MLYNNLNKTVSGQQQIIEHKKWYKKVVYLVREGRFEKRGKQKIDLIPNL